MSRKEIQLKKSEKCKWQIGGAQVANWRRGEKQLYSRTQCTCARLVNEKVRVYVSSRPILCGVVHFQWTFLPQSAMEEIFPALRPFVLPTHNHVSWGTWLLNTWIGCEIVHRHFMVQCFSWHIFGFQFWNIYVVWSGSGPFLPMHIDRIASYMVSIPKLFWTCTTQYTFI